MLWRFGGPERATAPPVHRARGRWSARITVMFVLALTVIVLSPQPASTSPSSFASWSAPWSAPSTPRVAPAAADLCSVEEWQANLNRCLGLLPDVAAQRAQCLKPPPPDAPDSGLGGWFASRTDASTRPGFTGRYVNFGYAGYSYTTYDIGCAPTLMHPDYKFENTVANGEFMVATAVIGASNAIRERAWDPGAMWTWADPLVEKATQSVYSRVFTVFGAVTLAVVGVYLLWRARQAEMSAATTTAGWAILVMVAVTAIAAWPVRSAHLADQALVSSLGVIHDAVGPPAQNTPPELCPFENRDACLDHRPPALRASDTAVKTMLYRNWLRGVLGSAENATAQKYGDALYRARTFTWAELDAARSDPQTRDQMIERKSREWMKIAEQIKTEDPEAYQYLQGAKGMERIGAGFVSLLAAMLFALFDLTASVLVLLGFLIFRWAVIAAPILGTVALLRPASAGFRRLVNAVVAALFNIIVFGTGAAIYLFAVDIVMNTVTIPGWLQVVLVFLTGLVGWLLLRPYRRITQLGGKDPLAAIAAGGVFNRRQAQIERTAAAAAVAARPDRGALPLVADRPPVRVELRAEPPLQITGADPGLAPPPSARPDIPRRGIPTPADPWIESDIEEPSSVLYRPNRSPIRAVGESAGRTRVEARAEP